MRVTSRTTSGPVARRAGSLGRTDAGLCLQSCPVDYSQRNWTKAWGPVNSNVIRNKLKVERRDQIPRGYFVLIGGSSLFEVFEFSVNAIDGRIPVPADSDG